MRFSQRIGKRPVKTVLQIESMDDDLKNRLWNSILEDFFDQISDHKDYSFSESDKIKVCKYIWKEFFKRPIDKLPKLMMSSAVSSNGVIEDIREWYFKAEWFEIYDFIEFIINISPNFHERCNQILVSEISGYRIINGLVVQITSEEEVQEIEEALNDDNQFKSVNTHLRAALDFLADKKNPDYRNSIKESISAVESLSLKLAGNANGKFSDALTAIDKEIGLHGSLKKAFMALYGYTSDSGGIRHALSDEDVTPTFEDAKFMLVSCSAFINYLKAKMNL
jgi:hypothetical protein